MTTSMKAFAKTSIWQISGEPSQILAQLREVSIFDKKRRRYLKLFIRFLVSSVVVAIFGTTALRIILFLLDIEIKINYDPLFIYVALVLILLSVYFLVRFLLLFAHKYKSDVGEKIIPVIEVIINKFGKEGALSIHLDLRSYKKKQVGYKEVENMKFTLFKDHWFSGSYQPKNSPCVEWKMITSLSKIGPRIKQVEGDGSAIKHKTTYEVTYNGESFYKTTEPKRIYWEDYKRPFDLSLFMNLVLNLT